MERQTASGRQERQGWNQEVPAPQVVCCLLLSLLCVAPSSAFLTVCLYLTSLPKKSSRICVHIPHSFLLSVFPLLLVAYLALTLTCCSASHSLSVILSMSFSGSRRSSRDHPERSQSPPGSTPASCRSSLKIPKSPKSIISTPSTPGTSGSRSPGSPGSFRRAVSFEDEQKDELMDLARFELPDFDVC